MRRNQNWVRRGNRPIVTIVFSLNVFIEFSELKIFVTTVKGFEPTTSCVRDHDVTTAPARHMWETYIDPSTCFINLSDSLNLQSSLNFFPFKENSNVVVYGLLLWSTFLDKCKSDWNKCKTSLKQKRKTFLYNSHLNWCQCTIYMTGTKANQYVQ